MMYYMATAIISEKEIRMWMMDRPELNTLIDGVRWSPEAIEQAQIFVTDYFNLMTPPTGVSYTVESFPSRALMLIGVCGHLLRGAAIGEASNELTYSAAGLQIDDRNKAQIFTSLGQAFWEEFKDLAKQMKITQNINQVYGVTHSEYNRRAYTS